MAHKKAGGSTALGRDSNPKYLGVKLFGGQKVLTGQVIIRQRGTKWMPGKNVGRGGDDTLFALADGIVAFKHKKIPAFTGKLRRKTIVEILPDDRK